LRPEAVLVNLPTVERGQAVIDAADLSTPRVPVWGFLHSSNPPSIIGAKLGRLRDRMVPALLGRFDYLLTVSASGAQAVSQRYAAGSSEILHPPIFIPGVELSPAERSTARLAVGLPQGYLLGVIGRVSVRHKGQDTALRVVATLRAAGHQVHLIVIGDGPDIGKLRSMAEELSVSEHVLFLGWREDAHELIPLLNAVIITSRHEGMPLTALQAAATGVPVVGYGVDGLAEFLPHTFRASYGDEARLAETISALMQGSLAWPAEEMRTLARSWADPEHAAERLLRLMSSRMTLQQGRPELVPD
jgi:glycosyltransferase involved in cell wall biosynthesis